MLLGIETSGSVFAVIVVVFPESQTAEILYDDGNSWIGEGQYIYAKVEPRAKCVNCDFGVTDLEAEHCCTRCKNTPARHGPRCEQVRWVGGSPTFKRAPPETKVAGADTTLKIGSAVKVFWPSDVGGDDQWYSGRITQLFPAEQAATVTYGETRWQWTGPGLLIHALVDPTVWTKCANCNMTCTGMEPRHCCSRCKSSPGEHGPRCELVEWFG